MPPTTHRANTTTTAAPERVWSELQQPQTWGSIGGGARAFDAEIDAGGNLHGYRFEAVIAGKTYPGSARTIATVRPANMTVAIDTSDLKGEIAVVISPEGAGSVIDVAVTLAPKGFLATLMFPTISGAVASALPARVRELAARSETN